MKIDDPLLTLFLAPFLFVQVFLVRLRTPKLPEAEGERRGVAGQGETLRVLFVGDSAGAGVGVQHQRDALSGQLVSRLAETYEINWALEAKDGNTTADTLALLHSYAPCEADVVIVSLGVNDVTGLIRQQDWLDQQEQLIALLLNRFKARQIVLNAIPPLHRFPALPQPLRWFLGRKAMRFNAALAERVAMHPKVSFLAMTVEADPSMFAADGFHPNKKAYKLWAELLSSLLESDRSNKKV